MNIKRIFISIFFVFIVTQTCTAQSSSSYSLIMNHPFVPSKIKNISKEKILEYKALVDHIIIIDQQIRSNRNKFLENVDYTDSINFENYKSFIEKEGYYKLSSQVFKNYIPTKTKIIKGYYTYDVIKKRFVFTNKEKVDTLNIVDFFQDIYTLQLHFSSKYGLKILKIIELSINDKKTCDEIDLMDYFITYLYRKTQFNNFYSISDTVGINMAIIPNLDSGLFVKQYNYSFYQYIDYCKKKKNKFQYILLSNLIVDQNNRIDLSKLAIKNIDFLYLTDLLKQIAKKQKKLFERIIRTQCRQIVPGAYSVLLCTFPNLSRNPAYTFNI